MALDTTPILAEIDAAIRSAENIRQVSRSVPRVRSRWGDDEDVGDRHYTTSDTTDLARANMLVLATLAKYAPPGSLYVKQAEAVLAACGGPANDYAREQLVGILRALRFEYERGALRSVAELVHADLFADFLAMARHLLDKGFKDPAAVLAAGVFEQHLRRLAERHGIPLTKDNGEAKRAETLNSELQKAGVYDLGVQKDVTAKLDLRNSAAHGEWLKYEPQQVALLIDWVGFFVQRFAA